MKKKSGRKLLLLLASAALAAGVCFAVKYAGKPEDPLTKSAFLLDTFCTVTLYEGGSEDVLSGAMELVGKYDGLFSAEREDSDIYRINHRKGLWDLRSEAVPIGADTAEMLLLAKEIEELSGGALWTAIRPLTELWDFKTAKKVPESALLTAALKESRESGWHIEREEETGFFFFSDCPGTKIEAGAFAKGFIADRIRDYLMENGVKSAIIDLGGNIQTVGGKPDGEPFHVGIKDPKGEKSYLKALEAKDISVVTAGNYERYFEENGVIYHHILDPETGFPVQNELASVTVTGPQSAVCDALATACFVKGTEDGIRLLTLYNEIHHTGYKGYFLSADGDFTRSENE